MSSPGIKLASNFGGKRYGTESGSDRIISSTLAFLVKLKILYQLSYYHPSAIASENPKGV